VIDDAPVGGSVPHAYRNALFWRWVPAMPRPLRGAFATVLYAMAAAANPAGQLRFTGGRDIRLSAIAAGAGCDQKDARRYLAAAEAAGVVGVEGERRPGRVTRYALILSPSPDWGAAVAFLEGTRRQRKRPDAPWHLGGPSPQLAGDNLGGPTPQVEQDQPIEPRGTVPLWTSGDRPPITSGDRPPNEPGINQEVLHDGAEVVHLPQVPGGLAEFKATRSSMRRDCR
jgi:hypothetical protein